MKTGIELIAQERKEQIEKHGYTVDSDVRANHYPQLRYAATVLIDVPIKRYNYLPEGWDRNLWLKMCDKSYTERLIIAGAWIAAEIDRINAVVEKGAGDDYPVIPLTPKD